MLCASGVKKRERSVSGLETHGRLCGESDSGIGPYKLFVFGDHWCQKEYLYLSVYNILNWCSGKRFT